MLEINCNKCENLCDKATGCKLYGADPAAAAKACRADLFINYNPRKEKPAKFTPGAEVWVVERDEDGTACEVSGFLFLAKVEHAVIVTPRVYGCEGVTEILDYHIGQTAQDYDTDLSVYPAGDCYTSREDAKVALETETGEED